MLNLYTNATLNQIEQKNNNTMLSIIEIKKIKLLKFFLERKFFFTDINFRQQSIINILMFFIPYSVNLFDIFFYKIFLEYLNKTYKFTRILYNLPLKKKRTHRKSKIKKWLHTQSIAFCIKQLDIFKNLKLPFFKIQILFFCEYLNSLWFFNWWKEWFSAYKNRIKSVSKNPHIKWNYDLVGLQGGKPIHFIKKKKKKNITEKNNL